jgi:hypothetical protein
LGKLGVVLNDIWLADIVKAANIGACAAPDAQSVALAIKDVATGYSSFASGLKTVRSDYLGKHSWKPLVAKVIGWSGLAVPAPRPVLTAAQIEA